MTTFDDLKRFFQNQNYKFIIAADAETRVSKLKKDKPFLSTPAGGVAVAFDPVAKASGAVYVGRGKTPEDRKTIDSSNKILIEDPDGKYFLKRVFISDEEFNSYYYGFSNQTLWPLCHVSFERPEFRDDWYEGFKKVNQKFAKAIKDEINGPLRREASKTFIWLNDYQLSLVPKYLGRQKNVIIGMFWHIPWPTWEIFRILPQKKELLESLLNCDFIAFHRGYQARNFLNTVDREFETRIDQETNKLYFNKNVITVKNLPMGVDVDVIENLFGNREDGSILEKLAQKIVPQNNINDRFDTLFNNQKVILGVDRLDYTKGLRLRLLALDKFFEKNKQYIGRVTYLGIIAPSREEIPSYKALRRELRELEKTINEKYGNKKWQPVNLVYEVFQREDLMNFYKKASVCLVTPLDDGMNLVSKEFVIASSFSRDPGMLVLSQFAGSSIDLTQALIVNPYNVEEVANAIKRGLEMNKKERTERISNMKQTLVDRNVYEWAIDFVKSAMAAGQ